MTESHATAVWKVPTAARAVRRAQARVILAIGDAFALALAITLVAMYREPGRSIDVIVSVLAELLPLYALAAFSNHAYTNEVLERWETGARRALAALALAALTLISITFVMKVSAQYSRVVVAGGALLAALTLVSVRYMNQRLIRWLLPDGLIDIVLLTDGVPASKWGSTRVLDAARQDLRPTLDSPQMLDRIGKALHGCDRVVLSCPPEQRQAWSIALKGLGNEVQILMPELDGIGMIGTGRFDSKMTAVIARGPLSITDMIIKRAFDLCFIAFLLPTLVIVTALVAIAIKLDDGGPIFFRQNRIGRGNRIFAMLKFRSMRSDRLDAGGHASTQRDDDRITRVGRWLRRTSIDELPQLFNVLKGDMSIVGPRPHALGSTAEDKLFWDVDSRYWWRHAVQPGLTGLAQVRGYRGATVRVSDLTDRVQADLEYLVGWTLWRDIRIVVGTFRVIMHSNAY